MSEQSLRAALERLPRYIDGGDSLGIEQDPDGPLLFRGDVLAALEAPAPALDVERLTEDIAVELHRDRPGHPLAGACDLCRRDARRIVAAAVGAEPPGWPHHSPAQRIADRLAPYAAEPPGERP